MTFTEFFCDAQRVGGFLHVTTGKRNLSEHSKIRLGQEEDGLAGRESRERSTSTELGTPDGARAQALEVRKFFLLIYPSPSVMFCMFSLVFFLFYFSTSIF